jgi:hypothetical protein
MYERSFRDGGIVKAESMRSLYIIMVAAVVMAAGCSCDVPNSATQKRLDKTIRDVQEHGGSEDILRALKKATPETLSAPDIVYARVYAQPSSVRLWIEWIEASPSPDAVLIRNTNAGYRKEFPFDETYLEENRKMSEEGVLFRFVHAIEPQSDTWQKLKSHLTSQGTEAVLLIDGQAASDPVQVELHERKQ